MIRLLVVMLLLCPPVFAEQMDLQAAIQYALTNNAAARAAGQRTTAAEAEIAIQKERANPTLLGESTRSQPNWFVGAGYLFELGDKRGKRIEIAQKEALAARFDLQTFQQQLRHDVRVAFYQVLLSRSKYSEVSLSRDLAQRLYEIANERFQAGGVPRLQVLQSQLEEKRRESEATQAQNDTRAAEARFNGLLFRNPQEPVELRGSIEDQPGPVSLESLVAQAISSRADIRKIQSEILAAEARVSLAEAERIPDLNMEAGTEIHDTEHEYGWRVSAGVQNRPNNPRKGEIAAATASLNSLKSEQAAVIQQVRSEVTESYLKYQAASFRLDTFRKDILPDAKELQDLAQESYHEGESDLLSALDAQRNLLEVRLEYLDALIEYQTSLADLEKAAGTTIP